MEILDLYDIHRSKTSKTHIRGEKVPTGYFRTVVRVAIFNQYNEMLIQKRQDTKARKGWDNFWDISASGSVVSGETSQQAIERELKEELGINFNFSEIRPSFTINFFEGYDDTYVIKINKFEISQLVLQPEEVADARWASKEEIFALIEQGEFIPWKPEIINLIWSMQENQSSLKTNKKNN